MEFSVRGVMLIRAKLLTKKESIENHAIEVEYNHVCGESHSVFTLVDVEYEVLLIEAKEKDEKVCVCSYACRRVR